MKLSVQTNQTKIEYALDSPSHSDANMARDIKWRALELAKLKRSKIHRMMMLRTFHHSDPIVIKLTSTKKTATEDAEAVSVSTTVDLFTNGGSVAAIIEGGTEGAASLFTDFGSESELSEAISDMCSSIWSLIMSLPTKKGNLDGTELQGCEDCPKPTPLPDAPPRSIR